MCISTPKRTCSELPSPLSGVNKFSARAYRYTNGEFNSCSMVPRDARVWASNLEGGAVFHIFVFVARSANRNASGRIDRSQQSQETADLDNRQCQNRWSDTQSAPTRVCPRSSEFCNRRKCNSASLRIKSAHKVVSRASSATPA